MVQKAIKELEIYGYTVIPPNKPINLLDSLASTFTEYLNVKGSDFVFGVLNERPESWEIATMWEVCEIAKYFLGNELRIGAVACKRLKSNANQLRIHSDGTEPLAEIPHFPFMINTMFCLSAYTKQSGAFCVIPFSHKSPLTKPEVLDLFNHTDIENDMVKPLSVECPKGSVILWDSRLWHGHYPNKSFSPRLNLNISYYPKWWNIRIEQNHEPIHPCIFTQMPRDLQEMVRYKIGMNREEVYEL